MARTYLNLICLTDNSSVAVTAVDVAVVAGDAYEGLTGCFML